MTSAALYKASPLSGVYRQFPVQLINVQGWQIAEHFGNPERERQCLQEGAVLADWSHIGKISLSGPQAAAYAERLCEGAESIAPLSSVGTSERVALRLTANDYLLLCQPGLEASLLDLLEAERQDGDRAAVINQTGASGCFALAGPRRDEILERSTAMNLRRDRVLPGAVIQTTVHTIRCTFYRTENVEILVHPRSLSESLFEALMDVGFGVGLLPTGVGVLPVTFATHGSIKPER